MARKRRQRGKGMQGPGAAPTAPAGFDAAEHVDKGLRAHQAGNLIAARAAYERVLQVDPGHAGANHLLGVVAFQVGELDVARRLIARAVETDSTVADYHSNLALVCQALGALDDAAGCCQAALDINPGLVEVHACLGTIRQDQGRLGDAEASYRAALGLRPDYADVVVALGDVLRDQGRLDDAAESYRRALGLDPGLVGVHVNLGNVLRDQGRIEAAAESYGKALAADPGFAEAHSNLGNVLLDQGRANAAAASFRRALAIDGGLFEAHSNLGNALKDQGRLADAAECYRAALAVNPAYAEAHYNLGLVHRDQGRPDDARARFAEALRLEPGLAKAHVATGYLEIARGRPDAAIAHYQRALAIDAGLAEAHGLLGDALRQKGALEAAAESCRRALDLNAGDAGAHNALGLVLADMGDVAGALRCYERALAASKKEPLGFKNTLHTLLYDPGLGNDELFETYRRLVAAHGAGGGDPAPAPARPEAPAPRLRVGYLSSDFHDHPVARVIEPLLAHHDHARVEVFCYAIESIDDAVIGRFRGYADHWRTMNGLADVDMAARIRDDGIHVMVYLGGHFDGNRSGVAVHRPAPVQVALHGGATTALDAMDYWLTDGVLHPDGSTERFTEELYRLPNLLVFPAPEDTPPVSPLPADDNGFVTFASFNKPTKINSAVLDLWSDVLGRVPDSRLMLKFKNYWQTESVKKRVLERLEGGGVAQERVVFAGGWDSLSEHLGHYHGADIGLDTFPFAGATTTFQALWMGVPVVSLMGERFISRMGGSLSVHAGLPELATDSPDAFVETAARLAQDRDRLRELRAGLRERVAASPVCDGPAYAAAVETAFVAMWTSTAG